MVDKVAHPQLSNSSIVLSIWVDGRGSGELRASMEWASLEKIVMSVIGTYHNFTLSKIYFQRLQDIGVANKFPWRFHFQHFIGLE